MDYRQLTDEELLERHQYYSSLPESQDARSFEAGQAESIRRELEARQRFQQQVYSPLQRVQEAAKEAERARGRIEAKPFSEAANPWDFGLGWTGLGMVTAQRKPQDVRYAEHALAQFVDGLDGVGVPDVEPWAPGQKEQLEAVSEAVAPLVAFRDSWASDPKAMERLKSAYDDDGLLGNTSGLTRAGVWMQSPLSAIYNQIQYHAGVPGDEEAERQLADTAKLEANTFLAGFRPQRHQAIAAGEPVRNRFDAMGQVRNQAYDHRSDWLNLPTPERLRMLREAEVMAGQGETGPGFLSSMGVPETPATAFGMAMDIMADPSMGMYRLPAVLGKASRHVPRAKRYTQAASLIGSDLGLPAGFLAASQFYGEPEPENDSAAQAGGVLRQLLAR